MADNNVLFATLLVLIASLVACVDIKFSILTATIISHFKARFNLVRFNQMWNLLFETKAPKTSSVRSEPCQKRLWVCPARTGTWWDNE